MSTPNEQSTLDISIQKDDLNTSFQASFACYLPDMASVEKQLKDSNVAFEEIQPFYKTYGDGSKDIAGYVIKTKDELIVAYRGTSTYYDAGRDAKALFERIILGDDPKNACLVHSGFNVDYLSSKESVDEVINAMQSPIKLPLVFTGHSLGGATAQIAAADYAAKGEDVKGVYTFGAPRVFAGGWSSQLYNRLLGNKTLHVICTGDIVPEVPPASLGFERTGFHAKITTAFWGISGHLEKSYEQTLGFTQDFVRAEIQNSTAIWASIRLFVQNLASSALNVFWNTIISISTPSTSFSNDVTLQATNALTDTNDLSDTGHLSDAPYQQVSEALDKAQKNTTASHNDAETKTTEDEETPDIKFKS